MASLTRAVRMIRRACEEWSLGYDQWQRQDIFDGGETDCSALVIWALKQGGFNTGSATYTGNLSVALTANGWKRISPDGNPQFGDVLLNDVNHVALYVGGGLLAQASSDENGGIHGGRAGDQTGRETNVSPYYNYPWNCYLRWTGEDDEVSTDMNKAQQWDLRMDNVNQHMLISAENKDGFVTIKNVKSGKYLAYAGGKTADGTSVLFFKQTKAKDQLWKVVQRKGTIDRYITIHPANDTSKCVAVGGSSLDNGASLILWPYQKLNDQRWTLNRVGANKYVLMNRNSHKALDCDA